MILLLKAQGMPEHFKKNLIDLTILFAYEKFYRPNFDH
jgi:hypothetical protein